MKVLILGSGSFAGQAIFHHLLKKKISVFGINRSKPKENFYWEWLNEFSQSDINWTTCNLYKNPSKMVALVKEIQPSHIIDLMGQGMVAQSWENPRLWFQTNLAEKAYLLDEIRKLSSLKKYIRASTPEVYGSSKDYITENHPFNPSTPYAVSHAAIDQYIRCIGNNYDFPFIIGRFGNFYGPGQQLYRIIPKAILCCLKQNKFILDGGGKSKRSFIFSSDFVGAIEKCLLSKEIFQEFNFNSNEEISIFELVNLICRKNNISFEQIVEIGPERAGKDMFYRLNCEKAKNILDWSPKVSIDQGIKQVSSWIKRNFAELSKLPDIYQHSE